MISVIGMIAVGSCNSEVTSTILQTLMEKSEGDLKNTYAKYVILPTFLHFVFKIV